MGLEKIKINKYLREFAEAQRQEAIKKCIKINAQLKELDEWSFDLELNKMRYLLSYLKEYYSITDKELQQ